MRKSNWGADGCRNTGLGEPCVQSWKMSPFSTLKTPDCFAPLWEVFKLLENHSQWFCDCRLVCCTQLHLIFWWIRRQERLTTWPAHLVRTSECNNSERQHITAREPLWSFLPWLPELWRWGPSVSFLLHSCRTQKTLDLGLWHSTFLTGSK